MAENCEKSCKYLSNEYIDDSTTKVNLCTGESFITVVDKRQRIIQTKLLNKSGELQEETQFIYNRLDLLIKAIEIINGIEKITEFEYDRDGKLIAKIESDISQCMEYDHDTGRKSVTNHKTIIAGEKIEYGFIYDNIPDNRLTGVFLPNGLEQAFELDGLNRTKRVCIGSFSKEFNYVKEGDHATHYVSSIRHGADYTRYTYDRKGNIASINEKGQDIAHYKYDSINRISCEESIDFGKTEYEYDNSGNIIRKTKDGETITYTYSCNGWGDQMLSYNGGHGDGGGDNPR